VEFVSKNSKIVFAIVLIAGSRGYPKIPVEMDGIEIDSSFN